MRAGVHSTVSARATDISKSHPSLPAGFDAAALARLAGLCDTGVALLPRLHANDAHDSLSVVELTDDDIIEAVVPPESGFFAASALSRLDDDLELDGDTETNVSDLVGNIARAFDMEAVPRLTGIVELDQLAPSEAWFVSVVTGNTPMSAIAGTSPLEDEELLGVVAGLVRKRAITLFPDPLS